MRELVGALVQLAIVSVRPSKRSAVASGVPRHLLFEELVSAERRESARGVDSTRGDWGALAPRSASAACEHARCRDRARPLRGATPKWPPSRRIVAGFEEVGAVGDGSLQAVGGLRDAEREIAAGGCRDRSGADADSCAASTHHHLAQRRVAGVAGGTSSATSCSNGRSECQRGGARAIAHVPQQTAKRQLVAEARAQHARCRPPSDRRTRAECRPDRCIG